MLKSQNSNELILGTWKAGESGKPKFIPLLMSNCNDVRSSSNIHFKGFTVYQEKMYAMRKISKKEPPVKITEVPDSAVIKFYMKYAKEILTK